ncbi:hypothetical protein ebA3922 [Aromatoleum aromaticum EbN1]|uniref:Uncharacterized protein n=1 Tax=Aromatoleum aromaticum (strain DSM 19018 / LMG 30748 / EbN1) TaxID=76114 RepID=Q5P2W5_AROAE|nr:hypothetical protein ebA3922 [Aromatoleum aromaticum EbN1]
MGTIRPARPAQCATAGGNAPGRWPVAALGLCYADAGMKRAHRRPENPSPCIAAALANIALPSSLTCPEQEPETAS